MCLLRTHYSQEDSKMFTDERRFDVWNEIRQQGIRSFVSKLTPGVVAEAAIRTGVVLVKSPLSLGNLAWLGIAAALHKADDFATVLTATLKILESQQDFYSTEIGKAKRNGKRKKGTRRKRGRSKHDPYRNDPTDVSEEAFAQARGQMPLAFWFNLIIVLGERFQAQHGSLLTFRGFRLLAMDGTCLELPYWKRLREHFGTARNAGGEQKSQARMVMLQFPLTRLPYRYELCPVNQGEVSIARRLSAHLCKNDLVLLDACFWSYGLFWDIQNRGAFFALPLKGKATTLMHAGRRNAQDQEVIWRPKDSRGQWKKENLPKSMALRVVTYQLPGFRPQQLVTNVLSASKITREDWTGLAVQCGHHGKMRPGLVHRRWEIETTYRELKVDQGMEGKLRSRTPESLQFEIAGHIVLYLLVRWLMVEAAIKHGLDPLRISYRNALRTLIRMHHALITASPEWSRILLVRLLDSIAEHQVPYRPGRRYPRRKQSTNYKTNGPPTSKQQTSKQLTTRSKPKTTKQVATTNNQA
jgi:Transposase DDE domain